VRLDLLEWFANSARPGVELGSVFEVALVYSAALQDGDVWPEAGPTLVALEDALTPISSSDRRSEPGSEQGSDLESEQVFDLGKSTEVVESVLQLLREQGFRGNIEAYEDPRNSLMDRVLERHLGLPITLCALAQHLCAVCGVTLHGISFPGHFLVGLGLDPEASAQPLVWDPFRGGRRLQLDELATLYTSIVGSHVEADSEQLRSQLRPCDPRWMLTRMLENLRRHFGLAGERERVADTLALLAVLHPELERISSLLDEHTLRRDWLN